MTTVREIRVRLPYHLRQLAQVGPEVTLALDDGTPVTIAGVLDALEARYPVLRGTVRDYGTLARRPFVRYFACREDYSHVPTDTPLPAAIAAGSEPFMIIGAIAGG